MDTLNVLGHILNGFTGALLALIFFEYVGMAATKAKKKQDKELEDTLRAIKNRHNKDYE